MSIVPFAGWRVDRWSAVGVLRRAALPLKQQGRRMTLQALPVMGFCFIVTVGLLGLLIG
jgi:hypothetical protein